MNAENGWSPSRRQAYRLAVVLISTETRRGVRLCDVDEKVKCKWNAANEVVLVEI